MIKTELLENLKVFDFEITQEEMDIVASMNKNIRKIVPVNKLKSGEVILRDGKSRHYPFHHEEPMIEI